MWREGDCERMRTPRSVQVTVCSAFVYMTTFFLKFRCQVSQLSSCFLSPHPLSSKVPVSLKKGSSWLLSNVNCFASHPGTATWACSPTFHCTRDHSPATYPYRPTEAGTTSGWTAGGRGNRPQPPASLWTTLNLKGCKNRYHRRKSRGVLWHCKQQRVKPAFPVMYVLVNEPMNHEF